MTRAMFPIRDVSSWPVDDVELIGLDEKVWLRDPDGVRWLFKDVTITTRDWRQGEDWSEKVAAELAALLGAPSARVELACRGGKPGSISRDLKPVERRHGDDGKPVRWTLATGASLLSDLIEGYRAGRLNVRGRPGHSLQNVRAALTACSPPPGFVGSGDLDAFGVFAGYLVAAQALQLAGQPARHYWLDRLASVTLDQVESVLSRTPEMSESACRFAARLLEINRRRLLDEC